jgi:[ribosomal protein S18]-alanine N-acetyltransferase
MKMRRMSEQDVRGVYQLESAATAFPWSQKQWNDSLNNGDQCTVAHDINVLVGCTVFSIVLDEATLQNIVVHPESQGRGYGRRLLQAGLAVMNRRGVVNCYLEVREGNQKAIALYLSTGFTQVGIRKNYYPANTGRENALVMCRALPKSQLGEI